MKTQTVDITPTWEGLLPALLELLKAKRADVREQARLELGRMAMCADRWNARCNEPANRW